jgi:hypothetical protein
MTPGDVVVAENAELDETRPETAAIRTLIRQRFLESVSE